MLHYIFTDENSKYKDIDFRFKLPLTVTCVDDKNKPRTVLPEKWIKEGKEYNIIEVIELQNSHAYKLKEVEIDHPMFKGYGAKRFVMTDKNVEENIHRQQLYDNSSSN